MPNPPRRITAHGRTQTLNEWAKESGISPDTICSRIDTLKWTPERAVTAKPDKRFRRGGRPRPGVPRPTPRLREDRQGRAFVRWRAHGRDYFRSFGEWGSTEAVAGYRRFAAEWATGSYEMPTATAKAEVVFVAEIVERWLEHVAREYQKLGKITSTYHHCRSASVALVELYGDTAAGEFTPAKYRTVRDVWVKADLARSTCNGYAFQVSRCFAWAAGQSLVPPAVYLAIDAVENLKLGRTAAPDGKRVEAVPDDVVTATLAALPNTTHGAAIRAMVRVQRLAGLRPQHLTEMRVGDVRQSGEVWRYIPPAAGTKTLHLDKRPTFFFGPKAQAELLPFLAGKGEGEHVFTYRKIDGGRLYRISRGAYHQAITKAARIAGVAHWHPHQLRHALATAVADRFQGIGHAAAAIGDNPATAAAVYVHIDPQERARIEVARAMG